MILHFLLFFFFSKNYLIALPCRTWRHWCGLRDAWSSFYSSYGCGAYGAGRLRVGEQADLSAHYQPLGSQRSNLKRKILHNNQLPKECLSYNCLPVSLVPYSCLNFKLKMSEKGLCKPVIVKVLSSLPLGSLKYLKCLEYF